MSDWSGWIQVGLAAVGLGLTVGLFALDRRRRQRDLSYAILSSRPILTRTGFDVSIRHVDRVLTSPHLVVWRLANGGSEPIAASDYETPLALTVDGAQIVTAEITYARPPDLSFDLRTTDDRVILEGRLLNPFDMFEVQMLTEGNPSGYAVEARIAGVPTISRATLPQTSWGEPWKYGRADRVGSWIMAVVILGLAASSFANRAWIAGAIFVVLAFLVPRVLWRRRKQNRLFLAD